jgi:hypothetical protein
MPSVDRCLVLVEETVRASLAHYEALLTRATDKSAEEEVGMSRAVLEQLIRGRHAMLSRLHSEKTPARHQP